MNNDKIIEIHRHFQLIEMSQEDPEVKAWLGNTFRSIGPYFDHGGKSPASGLSFDEQKFLLPEILGIEHTDKDFRKSVINFYHEFSTAIPKEGKKLNISLENDNEDVSKDNMPVNIRDYITYRHIINHPQVAASKADAERLYFKKFYIVDPEGVSKEAVKINALEDKAMGLYMKFKEDVIKVDQILTMLGVNASKLATEDKVLKLKTFAQKEANKSEGEQKARFNEFIRICEDKDLEYKFLIQEMIGAQILQRVGQNILYKESGQKIGDNMEDTVLYFKNPKNSRELNVLKANYINLLKRGEAYLPKDETAPLNNKTTGSPKTVFEEVGDFKPVSTDAEMQSTKKTVKKGKTETE